jgi:hypothetical protein
MAVRVRKDGRVLCAAMHPEEEGDIYINDGLHYYLSVERGVLVSEPHERHQHRGEWWWINAIPPDIEIDPWDLRVRSHT